MFDTEFLDPGDRQSQLIVTPSVAKFEASLSELPAFPQTDVADLTDLAHAAGPTGQSAHTMHRISDLAAELGPQYEETLREAGLSAALIVPLGSPQAPMAVLEFYRGAPVPSPKELSDVMAGVTGQLNAAIDRKGSENALVTAKNAFEDALRAKSEFVASISHEVRTPMNGVIGMTSLLADSKLTVEQKECVDTIGRCAEGLLAVVSNTLDLSDVEAGKLVLEPVHFDLRAVVEEVGARVRPSAQGKGLSFDARFSPDAPRSLFGDPKRIRQVLMNLASNAVKFTERGRILLRVDDIDSKGDEAHLKISVTDTGPGVPRQAVGAFFDTFSQVEPSTERKLCGSGLSLTLSKQLIELMGGEIGVETGEGVGSTFWFTIRLPARQAARVPTEGYAGTRVLILKAEEEATRELINLMYRWSLSVSEADSVESAANLLRSASGTGRRFQILIVQDDDRVAADALRPVCAEVNAAIVIVSDAKADLAPDVHYLVPPVEHSRLLDMIATVWETLEGHDPPAIPAPSAEPDSSDPQHQGIDSTAERGRARDEEEETLTRVLVVEDNLVNQKVAAGMLSRLGCRPTIAEHGLDALDWLERATFDLIFMDCQMPQMDGYRATQEIRRRENEGLWAHWHDHIPIVAMTANAMNGDREKCLEVDMDDYLSKPANSDQLQGMLERWARPELPVGEPLALALDPAPLEGFDSPVSLEAVETLREVVQDGFSEIVAHFIEDAE